MIHYHALEIKQKEKDKRSDAIVIALNTTGASNLYDKWTDGEITRPRQDPKTRPVQPH